MSKKIKLQNNSSLDHTKIVCFKKKAEWWDVCLANGDILKASFEEFPWLAKLTGVLVGIGDDLLINILKIDSYTPNDQGYLIGLDGGEIAPIQLSKEKGDALMAVCGQMNLAEEIIILQEKGELGDYIKV